MAISSPQHPESPLVSIVIPTFNRPELLVSRALKSARAQTHTNIEIIVVVDGGDDITLPFLRDYDPRIQVYALESNQGASAARNRGVQGSRGEWISFLDDDDEWQPDKLAQQLAIARRSRHAYPVVFSNCIGRTPAGDRLHPPRLMEPGERMGDYLLVRRSLRDEERVLIASMIFAPRALLLKVPFTPGLRSQEDWDWMLRAEQVPGVGFEQVPRETPDALTIYYNGDSRPRDQRRYVWRPNLQWALDQRRAGRLSDRATAGFILFQVVPLAVAGGDYRSLPELARALASTQPTPLETMRFLKHWVVPLKFRRFLRSRLDSLQSLPR